MSEHAAIKLPKELQSYKNDIEKTIKPYIKITAKQKETHLFQSKFGGSPYLPKDMEHPKDERGKHMKLLAQLNFEEIPEFEDLPKKGILQFYLSPDDDVMGLDFDSPTQQKNFRVIYHEHVIQNKEQLVTDFTYAEEMDDDYLPLEGEFALSFENAYEALGMSDFRFEDTVDIDLDEVVGADKDGDEVTLWDVYEEHVNNMGHKIGGYGYFTQNDPREHEEKFEEHTVTLLQIDTDDDNEIMWGDSGVGNFFIRREDLRNLDFSNVLYNWDCL